MSEAMGSAATHPAVRSPLWTLLENPRGQVASSSYGGTNGIGPFCGVPPPTFSPTFIVLTKHFSQSQVAGWIAPFLHPHASPYSDASVVNLNQPLLASPLRTLYRQLASEVHYLYLPSCGSHCPLARTCLPGSVLANATK